MCIEFMIPSATLFREIYSDVFSSLPSGNRPTYVTNAPLCTGFSGTVLTTAPSLPVELYVRYEYAPQHSFVCGNL
jgi:hypothetical protein